MTTAIEVEVVAVERNFKRAVGRDSESGAVALIVAIMLVVLLGTAALVVDVGAMYAVRRQMQTAADAAALAGVQELPGNPTAATMVAGDYATRNTTHAGSPTFSVRSTYVENDTLAAELRDPSMGLYFARFLGMETAPVGASAVAMVGSPRTYGSGVMPFGIVASGTTSSPFGYPAGGEIPLVVDTGDQSQGNWHYVDLTPYTSGANQTKTVISMGGSNQPMSIGDLLNTQPGAPNNPNFSSLTRYFEITCPPHGVDALRYDSTRGVWEPFHAADGTPCNRLIVCPVITVTTGDPYSWSGTAGQSVQVQVVGFMNMFVSNDPRASDGSLMATFVQVVPADALSPGGYIPYGGVMYWLER